MGLNSGSAKMDVAPDKASRRKCWDSRDRFFQCLNDNHIDNSLDPAELPKVNEKCAALKKQFESDCIDTWVKYFQEKRFNDIVRKRYIAKLESEGAQPLPFKIEGVKK
ncbi:uncharacterized protein LODBEIA_P19930 [Lodderomyces beijingensis]|uniref:Cytochrome c oxidase assembly factor 6 n=1 Tax=Lodderomyces beijingensis TaxID=1775926 RepID=A0ABP0ZHY8_9ASCO